MKNALCTSLLIFIFNMSGFSQVQKRDTLIQWQHFDYSMDENYSLASYSTTDVVTTTLNGIVLENELVKICLIPEFGARVISFIYKPTGKEQLYQNPIGTPYQIETGVFYHNWLMVFGGIFPTYPGPEHGKYWNVAWKEDILENTSDKITIGMSQLDTLNNPNKPGQYGGTTGIACQFNVSLEAGKPYFTVDVVLENDATYDDYEYWTCITFAPGSESGNTFTPANSEMIVPIDQYKVAWNPGNWMDELDPMAQSDWQIRKYDKLAHLSNWEDMGIAYAAPALEENFYGVINHDNENGLFRLSNDQSKTPGMKFWTWGNEQGLNADPSNFFEEARPYIELWSGVSPEFFVSNPLNANESISWTETYLPTVGIADVDFMTEEIAFTQALENNVLTYQAFYPVDMGEFSIVISLLVDKQEEYAESFPIAADASMASFGTFDLNQTGLNLAKAEVHISLMKGNEKLNTQVYNEQQNVLSSGKELPEPILTVQNQSILLEFASYEPRELALYDLQGKQISKQSVHGPQATLPYKGSGVYMIMMVKGNKLWSKKIAIR